MKNQINKEIRNKTLKKTNYLWNLSQTIDMSKLKKLVKRFYLFLHTSTKSQ